MTKGKSGLIKRLVEAYKRERAWDSTNKRNKANKGLPRAIFRANKRGMRGLYG